MLSFFYGSTLNRRGIVHVGMRRVRLSPLK